MSNKTDEFVAKLDGTYAKLRKTFAYAYQMGYRDGVYIDLDMKDTKRLDKEFKKWMKTLQNK